MTRFILLLATLLFTTFATLAADNTLTGTLLVANRNGGSISLIDLQTQIEIARLPIGPRVPHELTASPDGRWAVTSEYGGGNNPGRHLLVIDIAAARFTRRIDLGPNSRPHSIVFLQDSRHVITTLEQSDRIALVDVIDGEIISTWPTGGRDSHMVRLAPDDSRAYVAARASGTLSVIYLDEDRPPTVIPTGARAEGIAVSPDGSQVWVANQGDSTISVVDTQRLQLIDTIEGIPSNRIEFMANGTAVIPGGTAIDGSRLITLFDGDSRAILRTLALPASSAGGTGIRVLAAGDWLLLSDSALNALSTVAPGPNTPVTPLVSNADNVDGMAWSPRRLAIFDNPEMQ